MSLCWHVPSLISCSHCIRGACFETAINDRSYRVPAFDTHTSVRPISAEFKKGSTLPQYAAVHPKNDLLSISTCSKDLNPSVCLPSLYPILQLTTNPLEKHRKGSKESDQTSEASRSSSVNAPENSTSSHTSTYARSRETSLSAQSTLTRTSRPVSEDVTSVTLQRPSPISQPVTEIVPPVPSVPGSVISSQNVASTHPVVATVPQLTPDAPVTPEAERKVTPETRHPTESSPTTLSPQYSVRANLLSLGSITSHTRTRVGQDTFTSRNMSSPQASPSAQMNGQSGTNGVLSPPMSPKALFRSKGRLPSFTSSRAPSGNFSTTMRTYTKRSSHGNSYKIGLVQESTSALKKRSMAELGAGVYQSVSNVSYVNFLEWIRSERLTTLPHKGKPCQFPHQYRCSP